MNDPTDRIVKALARIELQLLIISGLLGFIAGTVLFK